MLPYLTQLISLLAHKETGDQRGSTFSPRSHSSLFNIVPRILSPGCHCPSAAWSLWAPLGIPAVTRWTAGSMGSALTLGLSATLAVTQVGCLHIRQDCWLWQKIGSDPIVHSWKLQASLLSGNHGMPVGRFPSQKVAHEEGLACV